MLDKGVIVINYNIMLMHMMEFREDTHPKCVSQSA